MIFIDKKEKSKELAQYKKDSSESIKKGSSKLLDEFDTKSELREQLAKEQGFICAYCMQRIDPKKNNTKIEHFRSQTKYPEEQLDYSNLLLCCDGGDRQNKAQCKRRFSTLHCDSHKGNDDIKYNPAMYTHIEATIQYKRDGTIYSNDTEWNTDLCKVLNLNIDKLKNNRKSVIQGVEQFLAKKAGTRTKTEIQTLIEKWESRNSSGQLKEYCGVSIYFLKKHPAYRI